MLPDHAASYRLRIFQIRYSAKNSRNLHDCSATMLTIRAVRALSSLYREQLKGFTTMSSSTFDSSQRALYQRDTAEHDRQQIQREQERLRQAVEMHVMRRSLLEEARQLLHDTARLTLSEPHARTLNAPPASITYLALPKDAAAGQEYWRIELHASESRLPVLGVDLHGDVIIGRGGHSETDPDVDLDRYGAGRLGVSRQHAILRPTPEHLYLADLSSTNGTRCNTVRISQGVSQILSSGDTISFGNLVFQVKIIRSPIQPLR
jgi:hypothetical protein